MRIARYDDGRIGVIHGHSIHDVTEAAGVDPAEWPPMGPVRLVAEFAERRSAIEEAAGSARPIPLDQVTLRTPIPWPNKLIAIPVNYHAHELEMSSPVIASNAGFFMKAASSLSGADEPIVLPDLPGRAIHHEAELAVIIGRRGRHITRDAALGAIFGYACLMDITVRGKQERVIRKSYDTFTPVGPIVTADEVGDPGSLQVRLWVNGELRQDANTRDMIVDIPELVAMCSSVMTLEPGDIIATGTAEGVGPIGDGDTVSMEIDRVGRMSVRVVQGQGGGNVAIPHRLG